ncbi:MAG TPA: hypothetical protein VE153_05205 [Myxococcus sp.]|nr:hypothetical protein [Myxococcus sp.]
MEAALLESFEKDPTNGETAFFLGTLYFWQASEWGRDASRGSDAQLGQLIKMHKYLNEAVRLNPDDAQAWCFLGTAKMSRARFSNSLGLLNEGVADIRKCAEMYPHFGLLMISITHSFLPINSPGFTAAVDSIWTNLDVCINDRIDRNNPDFTPYTSLTSNTAGPYLACWNSPVSPHNLEGFWLIMGNLLVKNNQPDLAVIAYSNAQLDPAFETWRFKDHLLSQKATAHERAPLYRDSNAANDPPMIIQETQCVLCHQK